MVNENNVLLISDSFGQLVPPNRNSMQKHIDMLNSYRYEQLAIHLKSEGFNVTVAITHETYDEELILNVAREFAQHSITVER